MIRMMKKVLDYILDSLVFVMTGKDHDLADAGAADYSGQGRNKYGR